MAWGNLTGIRINGELMELNSSMCVVEPAWSAISGTGRERQTNRYTRDGKIETVSINMRPPRELRSKGVSWRFLATQVVEETGPGAARVNLEYSFQEVADIEGAYYCFELPAERYSGGAAQLIDPAAPASDHVSLAAGLNDRNEYLRARAGGVRAAVSGARPAPALRREVLPLLLLLQHLPAITGSSIPFLKPSPRISCRCAPSGLNRALSNVGPKTIRA